MVVVFVLYSTSSCACPTDEHENISCKVTTKEITVSPFHDIANLIKTFLSQVVVAQKAAAREKKINLRYSQQKFFSSLFHSNCEII